MKFLVEKEYAAEELDDLLRPPDLPKEAKLRKGLSYGLTGGNQRDPSFDGIKLVWTWENDK